MGLLIFSVLYMHVLLFRLLILHTWNIGVLTCWGCQCPYNITVQHLSFQCLKHYMSTRPYAYLCVYIYEFWEEGSRNRWTVKGTCDDLGEIGFLKRSLTSTTREELVLQLVGGVWGAQSKLLHVWRK